jgi:rubredoxin
MSDTAPLVVYPVASDGSDRVCPVCQADLNGPQISQEYIEKGYYGDLDPAVPHYYSQLIGIDGQDYYDGVVYWRCPDCDVCWPRIGIDPPPFFQEALDLALVRAGAQPPDRLSSLAEETGPQA